ncbi:phage tail tube protein [Sphingomonas sp. PAMC 26605]|uniref:phage tail tube protein n=1 Tax=Sphingomonas sp. PAMC 26605 TaxID=1112214 RepID=UPI00026CDCBE|nr:phage tail tube protein [Sphingomonas sp. PAMC 26605]
MSRARGANAKAFGIFEATPGVTPAPGASWFGIPFVSHTLGEERPLIPSDLLGQGREMQDPTPDVATNDGDMIVPVDVRNFGHWLKLFFGNPVSTAGAASEETHVFTSGVATLPSMSLEIGAPEIPAYSTHYGLRGNQLKISQARSGLLNATCSLVGIGESPTAAVTAAGAGATASLPITRFPQASGYVKKDGQQLGSVVSADFTYSNALEKIETIKADGRIEDSDPGMVSMSGSVGVRFRDTTLLLAATNGTPIELDFGWASGVHGLVFAVPRVFLPAVKRPIAGPNGILATFNWQASGANAPSVTVTLTNDVPTYA